MIPFGEWLPDLAVYQNPGATEAKNVIPAVDGYKPLPALSVTSSALDSACRGMFSARANDGASYNYAGSGTKLYQLNVGTWTDQSKASGTYSPGSDDAWEFVKWGQKIIAVCGTGVTPQIISLGAVGATEFADLGGSPPNSRHIAVVKDFVVLGYTKESAVVYPTRLRWSGINDETQWTTDRALQSDYQDLQAGGGWIQRIVGGDYGLILQEQAITLMEYIGPLPVFGLDQIPGNGTPAPNSVVKWGDRVFFLGQEGFQVTTNGRDVENIGRGKVNKWFYENVDFSRRHLVVGALDRPNRTIMWIFPRTYAGVGVSTDGLLYDLESGRWSRFADNVEWVADMLGEDLTMEQLASINSNLDAFTTSLDSRTWQTGANHMMAFDDTHKSGNFDGTAMDAILETGEKELIEGRRTMISRVEPLVDGASTITLAPGTRNAQTDAVSWGSAASAERDGRHAMRSQAVFHRFRASITGGFTRGQGVRIIEAADAGNA